VPTHVFRGFTHLFLEKLSTVASDEIHKPPSTFPPVHYSQSTTTVHYETHAVKKRRKINSKSRPTRVLFVVDTTELHDNH
jgi:hypothetical protein